MDMVHGYMHMYNICVLYTCVLYTCVIYTDICDTDTDVEY